MSAKKKYKTVAMVRASEGRPAVTRGAKGRFVKLERPVLAEPNIRHTDMVLRKHARDAHVKAATRALPTARVASVSAVGAKKKRGFEFSVALSQVRDRVYSRKQAVHASVTTPKKPVKAARQPSSPLSGLVSPFVLDLKHRRTVVHHTLPLMAARKKHVNSGVKEQGVLSLFEDRGSESLPLLRRLSAHVIPSQKHINLKPRPESVTFAAALRRVLRRAASRYVLARRRLAGLGLMRLTKPQTKLQLSYSDSLGDMNGYVSEKTHAGRPIASRHIHPLLRLRRGLSRAARASRVSLSNLEADAMPAPRPPMDASLRSLARRTVPFALMTAVVVLAVLGMAGVQQARDYRHQVLGATDVALRELDAAAFSAQTMSFLPAADQFAQAGQAFKAAAALMENEASAGAQVIKYIPVVKGQIEAAQELLTTGTKLSEAARLVSEGAAVFADTNHFLAQQPLSFKLEYFFVRLSEAQPLLEQSATTLAAIDTALLPTDARAQIATVQETLPAAAKQVAALNALQEPLLTFLGHDHLQRHLIVFQNNTELRATGGFMGSLALVDFDRGNIIGMDIPGGGPYDFQGSLLDYVQAPRALRLINPRWELQDANWFLDWPSSAATIARFYERAGGPSVDSVIAFDTQVLERLLTVVGPVELPDYGVTISADNFRSVLQQEVEVHYDREENKPKKIIGDLAPILLERVKALPVSRSLELAAVLGELLQERHILINHQNAEVQSVFSQFGWGGEVAAVTGDYLAVVNTNIAGGKTDGLVQDTYDVSVHIDENGETTHTLKVRRAHTGKKGTAFTGVRNVDYLRVYVPAGSTFVSATPSHVPAADLFEQPEPTWLVDERLAAGDRIYRLDPESQTEIYEESGKTVFAQWLQVDPGQEVEATIVYRVPKAVRSYDVPQRDESWTDWFSNEPIAAPQHIRVYSLYWQKQPGAWSPKVNVTVNYPNTWQAHTESAEAVINVGNYSESFEQTIDRPLQLILY